MLREPRTWVLLAICVLIPVALLVVATQQDKDDDPTGNGSVVSRPTGLEPENSVGAGDVAPTFALETLDGRPFDTKSFRGTPYIVTFWGSWCVPCRKEMPLLQAASEEHAGNLEVVGVTFQDAESDSKAFGIIAVPQTFFVAADGTVSDRVAGIEEQEDLDGPLNRLLASSS